MADDVVEQSPPPDSETASPDDRQRRAPKRGRRNKTRSQRDQGDATAAPSTPSTPQPEVRQSTPAGPRGGRRSQRSGAYGFGDGIERAICARGQRFFLEAFPVQHRRGLAISPFREVERRDGAVLLCNQLHDGACDWPDGLASAIAGPEPLDQAPEPVVVTPASERPPFRGDPDELSPPVEEPWPGGDGAGAVDLSL